MKILAIGNSFSQDATRYLHQIAKSNNDSIKVVNLYISGCSLKTHYYNILEDAKNYSFEYNGETTGIFVTIKEALMSDDWDYITLQQVSTQSPDYSTYQPYLDELCAYVKKYCPHSKIVIHETWAYEENSQRLSNTGYKTPLEMFENVEISYKKASDAINASGIIPCGEVFINLLKNGIEKIHRDTFHATYGGGRYALALCWYQFFTQKNIDNITFNEFDEPVTDDEIKIIKKVVNEVIKNNVNSL